MTARLAFVTFLLVSGLPPAAAGDVSTGGKSAVGKVERVFVRAAGQVYVDSAFGAAGEGQDRWADVHFAEPLEDGRQAVTALIPDESNVERGDLTEVRFAHRTGMRVGPMREMDRVTALTAKYYSSAAINYGRARPERPGMLAFGLFQSKKD
jgi:hypothetical protein